MEKMHYRWGDLHSSGYFAGLEYYFKDSPLAAGVRFDEFQGDTDNSNSKTVAASAFVNWLAMHEFRIVGEYQYLKNDKDVPGAISQKLLTAQCMYLY